MSTIDRIRYYDGEFLRAFDFGDEQTYHMEMRRRLNRYLHLYGIAQGLNLVANTSAGVTQVSIMPGMAIDAFGREIYVFAPYTLGDNDIIANRITVGNTYDVWLRYQKAPSTPPSSGYSACNHANQYTRWVESFSVVLLASPSTPFTDPAFTDDDTDDPTQDQVGILLGTVLVDPTSPTATFSQPLFDPNRCVLIGSIAQRIQIPPGWDVTQSFSFLNAPSGTLNKPLSPPASLQIEPNVFMDQNLIVGTDFPLTTPVGGPTIDPQPGTASEPAQGNVKIAGDLFVQGNIYSLVTSATPPPPSVKLPPPAGTNLWVGISAYVNSLLQAAMPDFVTSDPVQIKVPLATGANSFSAVSGPIVLQSTKLSAMSNAVGYVAVSGIQLDAKLSFNNSVGVFITHVSTTPATPAGNQCQISVTYTVTGDFLLGAQPSILSFYVTPFAVCFP
jgi:hypothetical protein